MNTDIWNIHQGRIRKGLRPVFLKGVNLGGWLMPEGYILQAPNRPYFQFQRDFRRALGVKALKDYERRFRNAFITEKDFQRIKSLGLNCVRLPFHYRLVEERPYRYSREGIGYMDRAVRWAKACGLAVILDNHAVPGCQNHDWHSDSDGRMEFWKSPSKQDRAIRLWQFLADRYKDESAVAGYDLLNESVADTARPLNRYYGRLIKAIREVDRRHILFVEGNRWAQDIACLDDFKDDNLALSIHFYEPLEFSFNFVPGLSYPLVSRQGRWDKAVMRKRLEVAAGIARKRGQPLFCGEFGVNVRAGLSGEDVWVKDILDIFDALGIHWTYWTWKAVKHTMFPDGVYSYYPNPPWVNRQGPLTGWETHPKLWPGSRKDMTASWGSQAFQENVEITRVLKYAARKDHKPAKFRP
jgi:aryl-phospho-beta-D-glucosidase BglC (GH1 family)